MCIRDRTATFTCLGGVTMAPIGGNAASSSFEVDQFDTPSGGGGGEAGGFSSHEPSVTYQWEKSDNAGAVWNPIGEQRLRHIQQDLQHMQMIMLISIVVLSVQSVLLVPRQLMQLH